MKLLRDVVKSHRSMRPINFEQIWGSNVSQYPSVTSATAAGQCGECYWWYSHVALDTGRIRHNDNCSMYNPDGIEE